jgi:membrane dipeptidase
VWEGPTGALRNIARWLQLAAQHSDIVILAQSTADILDAKRSGKVAVFLGFQNTSPFADDYTLVGAFHRLGVRIVQLTYNIQNLVGGACYDPEDSGLSRFGRRIIREMNRVGVLIDLSHVGNRTCLDVIEVSSAPVAITHANPTWFHESPRNKPNDVIKAVAARSGVIGCCLYPHLLGETTTRGQFCRMVLELVEQIGLEHVAIGSDSARNWSDDYLAWLRNGRWQPPSASPVAPRWPKWPNWFGGPADFPHLAEGLVEAGLSDESVQAVLGGNWTRLFASVFKGSP